MTGKRRDDREIWSCSLCRLPGEDETQRLESALRQRELPLWEDAAALAEYLRRTGLSQAACAARLGRSQAAVANRLRLLKLPEDVAESLRAGALTERHARALLRLPRAEQQRAAAAVFLRRRMRVAEAESYVESLLSPEGAAADLSRERREALNRLWSHLEELQSGVPGVSMELQDAGDALYLRIRVPKG